MICVCVIFFSFRVCFVDCFLTLVTSKGSSTVVMVVVEATNHTTRSTKISAQVPQACRRLKCA